MTNVPSEVADRLKQWTEEGAELRQYLLHERDKHMAAVKEIDTLLAGMPAHLTEKADKPGVAPRKATAAPMEGDSMPETVKGVLAVAHKPMDSSEIIAAVKSVRAEVDERLVHSAIYRLAKRGKIHATGSKGSRRYAVEGKERRALNG